MPFTASHLISIDSPVSTTRSPFQETNDPKSIMPQPLLRGTRMAMALQPCPLPSSAPSPFVPRLLFPCSVPCLCLSLGREVHTIWWRSRMTYLLQASDTSTLFATNMRLVSPHSFSDEQQRRYEKRL